MLHGVPGHGPVPPAPLSESQVSSPLHVFRIPSRVRLNVVPPERTETGKPASRGPQGRQRRVALTR